MADYANVNLPLRFGDPNWLFVSAQHPGTYANGWTVQVVDGIAEGANWGVSWDDVIHELEIVIAPLPSWPTRRQIADAIQALVGTRPDGFPFAPDSTIVTNDDAIFGTYTLTGGTDDPDTGTLTRTLAPVGIAATGTVAIAGTLTKTLGAVTIVATASLDRVAVLASTLAPVTIVAAGLVATATASTITLDKLILAAAGTVAIAGTLTKTLGAVTSAPVLTASGVWASATHRVRVVLTTEPKHADMFDPGDATNPRTWAVTRLDTGAPVPVIAAVMAADDPANLTVDLTLLEPLATHLVSHTLDVSGLRTLSGAPMTGPTSFNFLGLVQTMDPIELATVDVFRDRDLANPPFQIDRGIGYSGTIVIGADGDYDTDAGEPLLRKLVMRRMGTRRGAIRHLPDYGLGLIEKEPIGASGDVVRLRTEIENQTMQEPDVISAQARLSMSRTGVLVVQLFVRAKSGLSLNIRMGAAGGRLVEL